MNYSFKALALFLCFAFLLFLGCKSALLDLCPGDFAFYKTSASADSASSHLPKCHQTPSQKTKDSKQNCDCPLAYQELRTSETSFSLEKWEIQWIKTFVSSYQIGFGSSFNVSVFYDFRFFASARYFSSTDYFLDSIRLLI